MENEKVVMVSETPWNEDLARQLLAALGLDTTRAFVGVGSNTWYVYARRRRDLVPTQRAAAERLGGGWVSWPVVVRGAIGLAPGADT